LLEPERLIQEDWASVQVSLCATNDSDPVSSSEVNFKFNALPIIPLFPNDNQIAWSEW
jgi:hypothetical protein